MLSVRRLLLVFAALLSTAALAHAAPLAPAKAAARTETATFAGGCFWCMETDFESFPGVQSVTSGYTGGTKKNPTYEEVGTGLTGHYESVEIVFDPAKVTYAQLLDRYWHGIDPTQGDGQFCDIGPEYRSVIFTHGDEQKRLALESKARIEKSGVLKKPIVTTIVAASTFYPAEGYHQDFWKKNPARYHEYREGCGRDRRTFELWGKAQTLPLVH